MGSVKEEHAAPRGACSFETETSDVAHPVGFSLDSWRSFQEQDWCGMERGQRECGFQGRAAAEEREAGAPRSHKSRVGGSKAEGRHTETQRAPFPLCIPCLGCA